MWAAFRADAPLVAKFLEAGASVHAKDKEGSTALSLAKRTHNEEVLSLLTEAGAKG